MHYHSWPDMCSSRFLGVVEKIIGIKKLPYKIKIVDLIECGAFVPELFVALPEEIFEAWKNYPEQTGLDDEKLSQRAIFAYNNFYYYFYPSYEDKEDLSGLSHPYDSSLEDLFVNEFKAEVPDNIRLSTHDNGRKFYPYEAYFPYWKSYVLLEALNRCKFIDRYLGKSEGKPKFIDEVRRIEKRWAQKYSSTFNRVSWFRTLKAGILNSTVKVQATYGELVEYVLQQCNSSVEDLKEDLKILLTLYQEWEFAFSLQRIEDWHKGMDSLRFDIWCIFEMLCSTGECTEAQLFSQWYSKRDNLGWANLCDVLPVEEILFKQKFERYAPLYLEDTPLDCGGHSWIEIYDNLAQYSGFECWIRAFCDMHDALNSERISGRRIDFTQPRLLDQLLVLTIRTEIILRCILEKVNGYPAPNDLIEVLKCFAYHLNSSDKQKFKPIFETATGKDNWSLTYLMEKPENIFDEIKRRRVGVNKWSLDQRALFDNILIFNTARNYFAHHFYKDVEMKNRIHSLPRDVLVACLYTVIQIQSFMDSK
jgi:hypothetical protein